MEKKVTKLGSWNICKYFWQVLESQIPIQQERMQRPNPMYSQKLTQGSGKACTTSGIGSEMEKGHRMKAVWGAVRSLDPLLSEKRLKVISAECKKG